MTQITKKLKISDFLQSLKKLKNLNFFSSTAFLLYNLLIILLLITINQSQFFFNKKNHYTVNFDISLHEDYFFKVNHLINVDINEAVKKIIYQDTIIDKIYVKKHLDHYNQDYRFLSYYRVYFEVSSETKLNEERVNYIMEENTKIILDDILDSYLFILTSPYKTIIKNVSTQENTCNNFDYKTNNNEEITNKNFLDKCSIEILKLSNEYSLDTLFEKAIINFYNKKNQIINYNANFERIAIKNKLIEEYKKKLKVQIKKNTKIVKINSAYKYEANGLIEFITLGIFFWILFNILFLQNLMRINHKK